MKIVADLHSHSRYSRAVSQKMILPEIARVCRVKGIHVVTTADWTHPVWFKELQSQLEEASEGLYKLKTGDNGVRFLLSTEIAAIYSQGGAARRIHMLIFAPNFVAAQKINQELTRLKMNLFSDGRPILGMSAHDVAQIVFEADERSMVIPAHIWTPWFSLYGSMSGFDSIEECFGNLSKFIYGIETGLSSDPAMNWRIPDLENRSILSFSDAHSAAKLGRELTVFEVQGVSYESVRKAIMQPSVASRQDTDCRIAYTIEFYPEEGKYHFTGHRVCGVKHSPEDTKKLGTICPRCKRELTVGVMHRVEQLADTKVQSSKFKIQSDEYGVRWLKHMEDKKPPYVMLVPLLEIIAEAISSVFGSKKTEITYNKLINEFGSEMKVLLKTPVDDIKVVGDSRIAEAILRVRSGKIVVDPGYDGVFGIVKIWPEGEEENVGQSAEGVEQDVKQIEQMGLF